MKLHVAMPALVAPFGGEHSVGEGMIWSESHMRKRNGPGLVRPPELARAWTSRFIWAKLTGGSEALPQSRSCGRLHAPLLIGFF